MAEAEDHEGGRSSTERRPYAVAEDVDQPDSLFMPLGPRL